jgi:hypothetical protein
MVLGFIQRRRDRQILEECEAELARTSVALAEFVNSPGELQNRAALLARAREANLYEHETVRRLDYLQRLMGGLAVGIEDGQINAFIDEARTLGLEETNGVRLLLDRQRRLTLETRGPEEVAHDADGTPLYFEAEVEYKNKPGVLRIADDGLRFVGEVALEIPWSNVAHVARTTHSYRGYESEAIAIQEGKRRTATKFVFAGRDAEYAYALMQQLVSCQRAASPLDR